MDYYEEFGLSRSASTDEIRQAYKSLARLLHPDQHQDENLRRLAECQMKRLNSLVEILTDPVLREQYDRALKPAPKRLAPVALRRWAWALAALVAFSAIVWYTREDHSKGPAAARSSPVSVEEKAPPPPMRSRPVERQLARRRAVAETEPRTLENERALPQPQLPPPPLIAQTQPAEILLSPPPVEAPPHSFGGTWFYAHAKTNTLGKALYPPEFIEAVIVEEGATLRGRYHARYKVADRPISPEVSFQFEGRASPDGATLHWAGDGGARGELQLTLLSSNAMRVNWSATSLGTRMGLSAGTAVLVRREER